MGMTLPLLPRTLPKRTVTKSVSLRRFRPWMYISATRFEQPMTLVGFDGFVGGDHHELLASEAGGGVGHGACAVDVVFDGLAGVVLHHGHVLVGGGVEDGGGALFLKEVLDALHIADVRDARGRAARLGTRA